MSANIATKENLSDTVILFGSPHKTENTAKLLSCFSVRLPDGPKPYFYYAYKENPSPCYGCGCCKLENKCVNDDLDELMKQLESCKHIIVASPIYNNSYPAPLKAVFDRFQRYYNSKFFIGVEPSYCEKKVIMLMTSGSEYKNKASVLNLLESQIKNSLLLINARICGKFLIDGTDKAPVDFERFDSVAKKAVKALGL